MWHSYFSKILQDAFGRARQRNPAFSLRGFARLLGVSPGSLSEILRGQRKVSRGRALTIAQRAKVGDANLTRLRRMIGEEPDESPRTILRAEALDLVLNPLYYRVLCALEILPNPCVTRDIADFLEIDEQVVEQTLTPLRNFGIVHAHGDQISWLGAYLTTGNEASHEKIRGFHRAILREAEAALETPVSEREFTAITFVGAEAGLNDAKAQIRKFRDAVPDSMRRSSPNCIYQLSIQLYPVSKTLRKGGKR